MYPTASQRGAGIAPAALPAADASHQARSDEGNSRGRNRNSIAYESAEKFAKPSAPSVKWNAAASATPAMRVLRKNNSAGIAASTRSVPTMAADRVQPPSGRSPPDVLTSRA